MARSGWFETVAEAQRRAQRRLPPYVYKALLAGSERGVLYEDNLTAFSELGLSPHVAGNRASRDLATTVMGQDVSMPVVISPRGSRRSTPKVRSRWRAPRPPAAPRWASARSRAGRSRTSSRRTRRPSSRCTGWARTRWSAG